MKLFSRTTTTPSAGTDSTEVDQQLARDTHSGRKLRRPRTTDAPVWPDANRWGTKLFLAVLVAAVLCGPAALLAQLTRDQTATATSPTPTSPPAAEQQLATQQRAAEAAAGFVEVWLTSTTADASTVAGLLVYPPEDLDLPKDAATRAATWPIHTTDVGPNQWSVVVRSQTDTTVAWWLVDVMAADRTARVMTLPGQIPPPAGPTGLDVDTVQPLSADHPAAQTAAAFLGAMLTGADTTRWTSPNSGLGPLQSPACTKPATDVATAAADPPDQPATGATLLVMATTTCGSTTYQYGLDLRGRDGRWEVAGLTSPSHVMAARPNRTTGSTSDPSTPPVPSATPPSTTTPTGR